MSARLPARAILGLLVAAYILVSVVAYTDFPRRGANDPLGPLERRGQAVWRANNCQACHQIYGFGGFLGPDLTNRVTESTQDAEFRSILTDGARAMPAFQLSPEDQRSILAFLRAVDETGRSQPALVMDGEGEPPSLEHFRSIADAWAGAGGGELGAGARRGLETWTRFGCGACHVPFTRGRMRAPDLSLRSIDRSVASLGELFDSGQRNMPPYQMSPDEIEALGEFLEWVASRRRELVKLNDRLLGRPAFSWRSVPWFEYP